MVVDVFNPGDIIRFTYDVPGTHDVADRYKEVFVLNGDYQGNIHGIDLKRISPADREVLYAVMDPKNKGKVHRIPLVNDILRRMDPLVEITKPLSFYAKFVRPFLMGKDAYRSYDRAKMLNATVADKSQVHGQVVNPKPLFHGISQQPTANAPTQQQKGVFSLPPIKKPQVNRPTLNRPRKGKVV